MTYYKSDYISLMINKMKYMDSHLKAIFLYKLDDNEIVKYKNYFNTITESHTDYNMCIICRDIYNMKMRMFHDFIKKNKIIINNDYWTDIYKIMLLAMSRNNYSHVYINKIKNQCFYYHIINKTVYRDLPYELKLMIKQHI